MISSSRLHREFNPLDRSRRVLVDQGQVTRCQVGEFPPPSSVGNFHPQNNVAKTQRTRPVSQRTATRDRPSQLRALVLWRVLQSFCDDGFEARGSTIQGRLQSRERDWKN